MKGTSSPARCIFLFRFGRGKIPENSSYLSKKGAATRFFPLLSIFMRGCFLDFRLSPHRTFIPSEWILIEIYEGLLSTSLCWSKTKYTHTFWPRIQSCYPQSCDLLLQHPKFKTLHLKEYNNKMYDI